MRFFIFVLFVFSCTASANNIDKILVKKAKENNFEAVNKLLEKGANPNPSVGWGNTLIATLVIRTQFEMADHLISKGGKIITPKDENLMMKTMSYWERDKQCGKVLSTIKYLKNKGFKIEDAYTLDSVYGFSRDNLLHKLALRKGESCLDLTEYVLDNGGNKLLNKFSNSMFGSKKTSYTPFFTALIKWNYDVAMLFTKHGLNLKSIHYDLDTNKGKKQYTPLMLTAHLGNLKVAKALIELGADDIENAKNVKSRYGEGDKVIEHLMIMY